MTHLVARLRELARKDSVYVLLALFIILFNILVAVSSTPEDKARARKTSRVYLEKKESMDKAAEFMARRGDFEKALADKPVLSIVLNLTGVLFLLVMLLGCALDAAFLRLFLSKRKLDIATYRPPPAMWSLSDAVRVVILFLFFAYVIIIIESFLIHLIPVFGLERFRMMLNSSIMDVIGALFVIYFTIYKYKERLLSLGLTMKNLTKNIFYGIVGYIASIPLFLIVVCIVFYAVKLVGYVPERQPVVELFLKEENPTFLIYSSIFASVFGPFIEELFFRGFLYNAAKKRMGTLWGMVLTSGIFAALHTNVVGFLPIMALGILLTYMYEKTGSLISSITVHVSHNIAMMYFVFLAKGIGVT